METVAPGGALEVATVSHYRLVAPALEALFGPIPLVWTAYPFGPERAPQWHVHYFGHWVKLTAKTLDYLASIGAQEFYSWFPTPQDRERARFMRLLLGHGDGAAVKDAALAVRAALHEDGRDAVCILDGLGNVELWSPLANAPDFETVRAYAHALAARVVEKHAAQISLAPNTHDDGRVHLHVSNNAAGRWTIMPYSVRPKTRRVATPVSWDELAAFDILGSPLDTFAQRFQTRGDVLAHELAALKSPPPLPAQRTVMAAAPAARGERNAHGAVLQAAVTLLQDGNERTAAQIEEDAAAAGLISKTPASTVDATLLEYIARCKERGRKALIVETLQHTFRLNEPPDAWPGIPIAALPPLTEAQQQIVDRLRTTVQQGDKPELFEQAVCDAFTALGFSATHMGGWNAPDGILDAPLGPLGYRVMLECKSGHALHSEAAYESAKYRDPYHAQYCVVVGSNAVDDRETIAELQNHGVSAFCVDDFTTLLQLRADPVELQASFQGGTIASDALLDLQWNRNHGEHKRVQIVAEIVRTSGWAMQCAAVESGPPSDAPVLTLDAAMLLVDQALLAKGAKVACTREEVQAAFDYLTSPLVNAAVWTAGNTGIVIRSPQ